MIYFHPELWTNMPRYSKGVFIRRCALNAGGSNVTFTPMFYCWLANWDIFFFYSLADLYLDYRREADGMGVYRVFYILRLIKPSPVFSLGRSMPLGYTYVVGSVRVEPLLLTKAGKQWIWHFCLHLYVAQLRTHFTYDWKAFLHSQVQISAFAVPHSKLRALLKQVRLK